MSRKVSIYQTLENRDNPEEIERDGPFICRWHNAWLGTGFYFWEAFVENSHWWGKSHLKGNYIICEAECEIDDETCFDLVGNTAHMSLFHAAVSLMKENELINKKTTVARVIHHMRFISKVLKCQAIRVFGVYSISQHLYPEHIYRMLFEHNKIHYLDFKPPIQICIFNKTGLKTKNYHIIFPDEYNNNYVV